MKREYHVKIYYDQEDQVFYVGIPGFPAGVSPDCTTFGETEEHAREMAKECIELMLEGYLEDRVAIPTQQGIDTEGLVPIAIDDCLAFALWLRQQRLERGLSQSQAAKTLGMSAKNYQRLENPKRCNPTLRITAKIREGFRLDAITI